MANKFGGTLSIKDGGFTTNIKSAMRTTDQFKRSTISATGTLKNMGNQAKKACDGVGSLTKKIIGLGGAYIGISSIKDLVTNAFGNASSLEG